MKPLNVRVPEPLLDEIDDKSDKRGFGSRSEFVRELLRDGIESEPRLDPDQIGTRADEDGETFTLGEVEIESRWTGCLRRRGRRSIPTVTFVV